MDEQSVGTIDTSSSVDSVSRVLTQHSSVESMSLDDKGTSVDEASVDPFPADTSRDSGINEPNQMRGEDPTPMSNQTNILQKNMINSTPKVRDVMHDYNLSH